MILAVLRETSPILGTLSSGLLTQNLLRQSVFHLMALAPTHSLPTRRTTFVRLVRKTLGVPR